jgi:hypothetical protein
MPAAPEERSRGPPLGGVHLGLGPHAATPEYGNCMGGDRVVFGLPPMARLHVQGMAEDQREAFVSPSVGPPVPPDQAFDCDDEPFSRGGHDVQKGLRGCLHLTVHEKLATLVEDTDIPGTGMQLDATLKLVRLGVESPAVSSSFAC